MISFFFNRFSKMVLLMEILGVAFMILAAIRTLIGNPTSIAITLLAIVTIEYIFIRFCTSVRWYKDAPRWSGIELQFKKALVPTGYIFTILGACLLITRSIVFLIVIAILLAVIGHVNIILLYLKHKDRDSTPVNYFSRHQKHDA